MVQQLLRIKDQAPVVAVVACRAPVEVRQFHSL
jgi:hypothetical protein